MRIKKLSKFIEENAKDAEPISDMYGLVAAAAETREVIWNTSDIKDDLGPLNSALLWLADLDPDYGTVAEVADIMRANLSEILDNPHGSRIEANRAISIAMWFAVRTSDRVLRRMAAKASMVSDLSFAKEPDIHVYTE